MTTELLLPNVGERSALSGQNSLHKPRRILETWSRCPLHPRLTKLTYILYSIRSHSKSPDRGPMCSTALPRS